MSFEHLISPCSFTRLEAVSGLGDLDDFLIRSRSGRMKEVNESSGKRMLDQMFVVLTFVHLKHLLCLQVINIPDLRISHF